MGGAGGAGGGGGVASGCSLGEQFRALKAQGVSVIAPHISMLVSRTEGGGEGGYGVSAYGKAAREAGMRLLAWTLERPGELLSTQGVL